MVIVALAILMPVSFLYSSDCTEKCVISVIKVHGLFIVKRYVKDYEETNQGLIDLVEKNNVVGREYHPDGRNLAEIKRYLEQHEDQIDFNFTAGSGYTALMRACYRSECSEKVVQLLCDKGANPNKGLCYPSTQCLHTLSRASDTATGIIKLQCEKLAILKAAALKNGQKLFLNKSAVDLLRDREEYKELFKDTEVR